MAVADEAGTGSGNPMRWVEEVIRDKAPDLLNYHNKLWVKLTKNNFSGKIAHWARQTYAKISDKGKSIKEYLQETRLRFRRMDQRKVKIYEAVFSTDHALKDLDKMVNQGKAKHVKELADRVLEAMQNEKLEKQLRELSNKATKRMKVEEKALGERDAGIVQKTREANLRVIDEDLEYADLNKHWTQDWYIHNMVHGHGGLTEGIAQKFRTAMSREPGRVTYERREELLKHAMNETKEDLEKEATRLEERLQARRADADIGDHAITPQRYDQLRAIAVVDAIDHIDQCLDDAVKRTEFMEVYHIALGLPASIRGEGVNHNRRRRFRASAGMNHPKPPAPGAPSAPRTQPPPDLLTSSLQSFQSAPSVRDSGLLSSTLRRPPPGYQAPPVYSPPLRSPGRGNNDDGAGTLV
ncbi:hypothetical protein M3P05_18335 [Sansalvadorimonas sp. 2012CJ34-2]|uniref:Retrotransposon gag domain-containing protein n=1 Tax=Parendozoicomonas callyspongiae TaxID=2942213 RepID=A0ABT0PKG3_9GAMM|nr:hypothetical protein [Sansalvadorimonas sp. 2012CJ34-2]MCL6271880.1 hypothetical protein [Sansalvadorimonas sp. 2012CJ34-2]